MDKLTEQLAEALRYPGRCYCAEKRWNLRDETALCVRCAALAAYDAAKARDEQRDPGMCPHGYPQTVRCSRCGE
jgi:hypothetical protein